MSASRRRSIGFRLCQGFRLPNYSRMFNATAVSTTFSRTKHPFFQAAFCKAKTRAQMLGSLKCQPAPPTACLQAVRWLRTCIHYFHRHLLCPKNVATALKMLARCPLTALFALYPRFYFIKSAYGNSEYRFLDKRQPETVKNHFQAAFKWLQSDAICCSINPAF